jgi:hypothetical protein
MAAQDPHSGTVQQSLAYHHLYALFTKHTIICPSVGLSLHLFIHRTKPVSQLMNCEKALNAGYINKKQDVITYGFKFMGFTLLQPEIAADGNNFVLWE